MSAGVALRLVTVMVLWTLCFPLITVGLDLAPHLAFATMRAVLTGLALLAAALVLRRPFPTVARTWAVLIVTGLGATSLGFLGMFHAAEFVSPGLATVIANAQPLLAAVLAYAALGESLTRKGIAGLAVGFAGIVTMALPGIGSGPAGGYLLGVGYIALAAAGLSVAYVAMGALKLVTLNRANAFTFLVPIFGLAIGAVFFDERLSLAQAAGVTLVVAGIALVQLSPPRQHLRPGAPTPRRSSSFGAIGTPVVVGLAEGLQEAGSSSAVAQALADRTIPEFLNQVAVTAIGLGLIGREGDIIRSTLWPMLAYRTLAGLLALGLAAW